MNDFDRRKYDRRASDQDRRMNAEDWRQAHLGGDVEATRREIARSRRQLDTVLGAVLVVVLCVLLFGCWCVYHILKTKKLVP